MSIQENLELKRAISTPTEVKLRYDWKCPEENDDERNCEYYNIGKIADKIGEALVNAALVEDQSDIFYDENKQLVVFLTRQVSNCTNVRETCPPSQDLANHIMEEVLIRNGRRDMTHAFIAKCGFEDEYHQRFKESRKRSLIRCDGSIVP
jgi:hypothetical protein